MATNPSWIHPAASGSYSELFVMVLAAGFITVLALVAVFNKWNRPDLDPRHATVIIPQLDSLGGSRGASVVVRDPRELDSADLIHEIRGLFTGEVSGDPTVRSATREVIHEIRSELHSRAPPVAKVPVRAVQEAILTALFGALAVVPIAVWRDATEPAGGFTLPSLPEVVDVAATGWDGFTGLVMAFPYLDTLFSLALTFGIMGADAIWTTWFLPPAVLLVLATLYLWLDHRVESDRDLSGPSVAGWTRRFIYLGVVMWVVGAGLTAIGALIPYPYRIAVGVLTAITLIYAMMYVTGDLNPVPEGAADAQDWWFTFLGTVNWKYTTAVGLIGLGLTHPALAVLAAFTAAGALSAVWIRRTMHRWRRSVHHHGWDALGLDITHSVTVTVAALTLPLMMAYAAAAFGTGKALAVARVVVSAPPGTLYAVLVLAVVVALAGVVLFADRFGDVRRGFRRAMSVQAVRSVLFARALPFAVMLIVALVVASFGFGLVAVVAVTLTFGLMARLGTAGYNQITYRLATRGERDESANRVVISGREVHDADDNTVFVADVNGHRTAHRDVDPLVEQAREDARGLLRDGEVDRGSWPRYYYVNGVRRGKVDMEAVAAELLGDVRTRFVANVQQTDAGADEILRKLDAEYPHHVVRRVVQNLKDRGRVTRREDTFQWMG